MRAERVKDHGTERKNERGKWRIGQGRVREKEVSEALRRGGDTCRFGRWREHFLRQCHVETLGEISASQ